MKSTEFVACLADLMEVERTEVATVDRALAKQGLRQLARGRYHPDITLREGVQIVCAWAGARKLTDAALELKRLEQYYPYAIPDDEYETTTKTVTTFANVLGQEENYLDGLNFVEVVSWVAKQLGENKHPAESLWVSIEKGGAPELELGGELEKKRLKFQELRGNFKTGEKRLSQQSNVKIVAKVRGSVLKWIFDVTGGE